MMFLTVNEVAKQSYTTKNMNETMLIKRIKNKLQKIFDSFAGQLKFNRIKKDFDIIKASTQKLALENLVELDKAYPPRASKVGQQRYSIKGRKAYTENLFENVIKPRLRNESNIKAVLEVAGKDGLIHSKFEEAGLKYTMVDLSDKYFDPKLVEKGICQQGSALNLPFKDDSFDFSYSIDALEHISDPKIAIEELVRVTRPGGVIFLSFGPLYNSSGGPHANWLINIPYFHILFSEETINNFLKSTGRGALSVYCNRQPLALYNEAFEDKRLECEYSKIFQNYRHLDIVKKHLPIFKAASSDLREFTTAIIVKKFRVKK